MKSGEYLSPEKGMIEVGETDTSSPTTGSVSTKLLVEKLNYEIQLLDESIADCAEFMQIVRQGKLVASRETLQGVLGWVKEQNKVI